MGYQAINSILEHSKIKKNKNQFLLMLILGHYANDANFVAFPAIQTLVENTGLHRTTVMRTLAKIEKNGEVSIQHSKPNRYTILLPRIESKSRTKKSDFSSQSKSRFPGDEKSLSEPSKVASMNATLTPKIEHQENTTNGGGDSFKKVLSKFPREIIFKYVVHRKASGKQVDDVDSYTHSLLMSSNADPSIQNWLDEQKVEVEKAAKNAELTFFREWAKSTALQIAENRKVPVETLVEKFGFMPATLLQSSDADKRNILYMELISAGAGAETANGFIQQLFPQINGATPKPAQHEVYTPPPDFLRKDKT
jgi:hypothetical protein